MLLVGQKVPIFIRVIFFVGENILPRENVVEIPYAAVAKHGTVGDANIAGVLMKKKRLVSGSQMQMY